jgi:hypothetical protein
LNPGGWLPPNRISSLGRRGPDWFRLDQRARSVLRVRHCTALNCNYARSGMWPPCRPSMPVGSRPGNDLRFRRSGQVVQDRPSPIVGWADIPGLSTCVGRRPAAGQQYWQQSRRNGADPRPSAFRRGVVQGARRLAVVPARSVYCPSCLLAAVTRRRCTLRLYCLPHQRHGGHARALTVAAMGRQAEIDRRGQYRTGASHGLCLDHGNSACWSTPFHRSVVHRDSRGCRGAWVDDVALAARGRRPRAVWRLW